MLPVLFSLGPITIHTFGVMVVVAFLAGSFVFWKRGRDEHYDQHDLIDLVLVSVFWGIVAGRAWFVAVNFEDFGVNVLWWLSLAGKPGLAWQGFFVGGLWALVRFCRKYKWEVFQTLDLAVMGLSLAQVFVWLGLFLSGGGVGKVTSLPVGVTFPGVFERRHPVGVYASLLWLLVFWLLWWLEERYRKFVWYQHAKGDAKPGFLFFLYAIGFGLIEVVLALVKEGELVRGIDIGLVMGLGLVSIGVGGLYVRSGRGLKLGSKLTERARNGNERGRAVRLGVRRRVIGSRDK